MTEVRDGRVWVISELYYPEETSTGYFMTGIAEGIALSREVRVVCSQPTYASRGTLAPREEQHNGVIVRRCFGTRFSKDVLSLRLVNIITLCWSIFFHILQKVNKRDQVIVVTNPPVLPVLVMIACRIRRARYYLLIHDVYPDVLVACGLISRHSIAKKLIDCISSVVYRSSEQIIVLGRDMKARLNRTPGLSPEKTVIIPNWGDTELIRPANPMANPLLVSLGLESTFVIQYSGNMGRTHGLEDIVEAARLIRNDENIRFLLVGRGAKKRWLQRTVLGHRLSTVTILDNQQRTDLGLLLTACHVAVISLVSGMSGVSVPSRLYNVLASGRPIIAICDADSEVAQLVREHAIGWVVPTGQPVRLARVFKDAEAARPILNEMGKRARQLVEREFTIQHILEKYRELLNRQN